MLKVAILGANGFIGSRAVELFHLEELAEVRPVVRRVRSMVRPSRFQLDCRVADGFDQEALAAAFAGCEVVVHAIAGDPAVILGTLAPVYEAAQKAGVRRLVYLSTASVHGQAPESGTTERSRLNDRQPIPYNNAKVRAERHLLRLRARGAVELVRLRPGIVFGPRSYWISSFADALLKGKAFLIDRGRGVCNSIYVDNLIHAIQGAMTAPAADGEAFLLGDRELVTWADLYRPIATALGFDLASIPDVPVPTRNPSFNERLRSARESKTVRSVSSILPKRIRRALGAAISSLKEPAPRPSPWASPTPAEPVATLEMELLYRSRYKPPFEKAAKLLGYEPRVSFELACRRTVAWLAFAGYPVINAGGTFTGRTERIVPDKLRII